MVFLDQQVLFRHCMMLSLCTFRLRTAALYRTKISLAKWLWFSVGSAAFFKRRRLPKLLEPLDLLSTTQLWTTNGIMVFVLESQLKTVRQDNQAPINIEIQCQFQL